MQIKIKQHEIIAAITGYITSQGISLAGKKVEVDFTAGRGDSGLTADINIEDPAVEAAAAPNKPMLVGSSIAAQAAVEEKVGGVPESQEPAEAAPAAPVAGKSLFAAAA